jgi:AcrR family transcriptional regulator
MSKSEIRIPKQERSKEKKDRIVRAGYEVFCEKGYHNTNTAEIAKRAGVATGSVYSYFQDKKSIFLAMLDLYANDIAKGMFSEIEKLDTSLDMPILLNNIINSFIKSHVISKSAHEEMLAMSHLDEDVRQYFQAYRAKIVEQLVEILFRHGIYPANAKEKIYLAYNLIEELCHEIVYHKQDNINYDIMIEEAIKIIMRLLEPKNESSAT